MLEHNKIKLSIMVTAITILGTGVLITNVSNTAFGQGIINDMLRLNETQDNMTQGNMSGGNVTAVIDVDTLTQNIKERHPILAQMTAEEDQSLMSKIKGMDSKEAVKTTIALDILRLLQQYKQLDLE